MEVRAATMGVAAAEVRVAVAMGKEEEAVVWMEEKVEVVAMGKEEEVVAWMEGTAAAAEAMEREGEYTALGRQSGRRQECCRTARNSRMETGSTSH